MNFYALFSCSSVYFLRFGKYEVKICTPLVDQSSWFVGRLVAQSVENFLGKNLFHVIHNHNRWSNVLDTLKKFPNG